MRSERLLSVCGCYVWIGLCGFVVDILDGYVGGVNVDVECLEGFLL